MSGQIPQIHPSIVSVYGSGQTSTVPMLTIAPEFPRLERDSGGAAPSPLTQFVVTVCDEASGPTFDWSGSPDVPEAIKEEIETEVRNRIADRTIWTNRVQSLVDQVETWAREMGWSTRRVEKKLEDTRIGTHRVPALLMQEDTFRVLLEPVGRMAPRAEGIVDLYLMPAYDDIASLYYYKGGWNVHYVFPDSQIAATVREADAMPLSKEVLAKILSEMIQHAA